MSAEEILNAAQQLSVEDRIELVHALWDSVFEEGIPEPDDDLRAELDRRIVADDADPGDVISLEELERRVRS